MPVLDVTNHQLLGVVSIMDLLIFIAWGPYFESGDLEKGDVTQAKNLNRPISQVLGLTQESRGLYVVEPEMPLTSLVQPFALGFHRLLVPQKDDDGKRAYRVLSQSDVVSYIFKHRNEVKDIVQQKLSDLGFKPKEIATITSDTPAIEGFRNMTSDKVPALAVVDKKGKLVGNLSASDLRGMSTKRLKEAVKPVTEFLESIHGSVRDPITISFDETLETAMDLIVNEDVHRLWVIDEQEKPIGCISLTNIINVFAIGHQSK
jgi:CBS domain-containing protein